MQLGGAGIVGQEVVMRDSLIDYASKPHDFYKVNVLPVVRTTRREAIGLMDVALRAVCEVTGFTMASMKRKCRERKLADARFMLYKLLRHEVGATGKSDSSNLPYALIAEFMGRDHGAIIHGVNVINELLSYSKPLRQEYQSILKVYEDKRADFLTKGLPYKRLPKRIIDKPIIGGASIKAAIARRELEIEKLREQLNAIKEVSYEGVVQE